MGTKTYIDRQSLWIVITTSILILLIVITGVCVRFFVDETITRIVLITLICLLSILGVSVLTYLELRKKTVKTLDKTAAKNGYYYNNIQPSAPRDPNWEYSNRSTVQA